MNVEKIQGKMRIFIFFPFWPYFCKKYLMPIHICNPLIKTVHLIPILLWFHTILWHFMFAINAIKCHFMAFMANWKCHKKVRNHSNMGIKWNAFIRGLHIWMGIVYLSQKVGKKFKNIKILIFPCIFSAFIREKRGGQVKRKEVLVRNFIDTSMFLWSNGTQKHADAL